MLAGFARHHSHWRTDIPKHSVGLCRKIENLTVQGLFGEKCIYINLHLYLKAFLLRYVLVSLLSVFAGTVSDPFPPSYRGRGGGICLSVLLF